MHSNRGIHFVGQVLKNVCSIWPVIHFHCSYCLQSSGFVKCTNGTSKIRQRKRQSQNRKLIVNSLFNMSGPKTLLQSHLPKDFPRQVNRFSTFEVIANTWAQVKECFKHCWGKKKKKLLTQSKDIIKALSHSTGFPGSADGKESACNAGDLGLILESRRPLKKGIVTHPSILAWRIPWTDHGVTKSQTRLSD